MPAPRLRRALRASALAAAAALALGLAGAGLLWMVLPDPAPLATRNPPTTALIEQRRAEAAKAGRRFRPQQTWVPLERISRRLVEAVVASEDAKFFGHGGFDWAALREAAGHDLRRGRFARGASTITQQLAKNLWLGTEKSLVRKGKEAVLAAKLERTLDKRRILALYLNVAEWGDGTFGVEAGARRHLGVSAGGLDAAQAVLLASMLPAPRKVDLSRPAPWLRARASRLLDRLHAEHQLGDEEHRAARASLARLLGMPAPADERAEPPEEEAPTAPAPEVAPEGAPPPAGAESPSPGPDVAPPGAAAPAPASAPPATPSPDPGGGEAGAGSAPDQGGPGTGGQAERSPNAQPVGSPQE
ncbi:MAG: monofunctional biosynthetic peptidoglycan transglycosylase [Anaeromyxobacteraceae bacterium]|nr:monofunctional biosynthetic peptidoglycan transglycosylase [Anaeromyxobacteraceae bacterium]